MGFFFKSKRSSISAKKQTKPAYTDLDPAAYLSESPKSPTPSPRPTSSLFSSNIKSSSNPSTPTTGKSLLDDILDSFDDKKTTTFSSSTTRNNSDYDFFKTESNDRYPTKFSSVDNYTSKYSSGSAYGSNEPSYKRVYKLGSDSSNDTKKNDYSSKYSSTTTSNDKDTFSIYTKYLQNEDKSPYSSTSNTYGSKYSSTNDRYGSTTNRYGSTDNIYSSKYSSNNDNIYSSKYTSSSTTSSTTYKWTSSSNSNKYSTYDDDRRNRFDDERRNRFEDIRSRYDDKYGSSNLFDDRPEKPSWKSSLFQERSRSETRFSENDNRGKTPAQILKELRERNLESIKQKKKERGEEVSDDEEATEPKTEKVETPKPEPKKFVIEDSDSDSDSDDLNADDDDDDDDDIPLNVLEGGENKVESWLNSQNKKKQNLKKEIVKPKLKRIGSKASIMSNSKNAKSGETNSVSSNSTSNNSSNTNNKQTKKSEKTEKSEKPEIPNKDNLVRSSSATSLSRPNKPTKKASFSRSPSKTRINTKHASLIPPAHPSPLVNQISPLPTAIQMPVMGQQIIAASPLVQPVMVAPSTPVMQPVMVPQFTQQFQPIFVNPGIPKPVMVAPSPKLAAKTITPKKGNKKKKAAKKSNKNAEASTPTTPATPSTPASEAATAN
ncbi:hypothetical protein PIROE2DRAFT_20978 [Piromyces sp. E2]|nr:hypothetical protein PIROE2DRAFT_20978 [Piromyces sp. E2]|eukprot:OUM61212.1 hypothetical protein PIROE2DRAFT_20978 [Piromyces sp. E2]